MKKLVTNARESDGRFALRLESAAAVQRDQMRQAAALARREQVVEENAVFMKECGFDQQEAKWLFA